MTELAPILLSLIYLLGVGLVFTTLRREGADVIHGFRAFMLSFLWLFGLVGYLADVVARDTIEGARKRSRP